MGYDLSTLMVTEDGNIFVFGRNSKGELGVGSQDRVVDPTRIGKHVFGGDDVVMASLGTLHSGCVTSTGTLWMWGDGAHGALGIAASDT